KGVMYTHRGAYLNALAEAHHAGLDSRSVFLWTLPMFHCNGWCFPWAVTAVGARHVCLRKVDPPLVWRLLADEGVTHLNGAPTVLVMLGADPAAGGAGARSPPLRPRGLRPCPARLSCSKSGRGVLLPPRPGPSTICSAKALSFEGPRGAARGLGWECLCHTPFAG